MLTDSHCHLASARFSGEVPEVVARARGAGVRRMVTLATCPEDIVLNREIAERHEGVFFCPAIHPCDAHGAPDDFEAVVGEALDSPKAAAVGETGLDYFHPAPEGWGDEAFRERQRDFLERHFVLAGERGMNVVIHTRDQSGKQSFEDALAIYARHAGRARAVFHCFVGALAEAERVVELGGLVSFTGIATFPKAGEVMEVARALPAGSFMVETDSPYLAPVPHRGKRCEPGFVRHVAEAIAAARGESPEELARQTEAAGGGVFPGIGAGGRWERETGRWSSH